MLVAGKAVRVFLKGVAPSFDVAVGYHFVVGAPPILVYFSGIGMFTGGTGF